MAAGAAHGLRRRNRDWSAAVSLSAVRSARRRFCGATGNV